MTIPVADWQDTENLENVFITVAEGGDPRVVRVLNSALLSAPCPGFDGWPAELAKLWREGVELALEGIPVTNPDEEQATLVSNLARYGFDSMALRDLLATLVRRQFAGYADPAGLIKALGVHDSKVPTPDVVRRLCVAECLKSGAHCWHPVHGAGVVVETDELVGEVSIRFQRVQALELEVVLAALVVVRRGSALDDVVSGRTDLLRQKHGFHQLRAGLAASLVPEVAEPMPVLQAFLCPDRISESGWAALSGDADDNGEDSVDAPVERSERDWSEARNLQEMVLILEEQRHGVDVTDEALGTLRQIWEFGCERPRDAEAFSASVVHLQRLVGQSEWLGGILAEFGGRAVCWQDVDVFVGLTDGMAGRLLHHWFAASLRAVGIEWLCTAAIRLPMRCLAALEKFLSADPEALGHLVARVALEVAEGDPSADLIVWLWRSDYAERVVIREFDLVLRVLGEPVRGSYLKAAKDLHRFLFEDPSFLRFILHDGEEEAVVRAVTLARHSVVLDKGEQQSLLVKIVRAIPEARVHVEQRQTRVIRKRMPKVTSVRSFEQRRRELEEITNVKIPANSRAIGHARGYGDLRENAEYKAAKEEQAYLTARRAELENALHEILATDFADVVSPVRVVPGSTAVVVLEDGAEQAFHVLGLWDSEPEHNIISYQTPLGEMLLGCEPGDQIEMPNGHVATLQRVEALSEEMRRWLSTRDLG
jgi:transcription elongation GreA/GreB family factor